MKTILLAAAAAVSMAGSAMAWEGQAVACYDKVWMPATYGVTKHLEYPAKMKWEHRNGQMVEMHYPPIYMEKRHMIKEGHYVLRKAPCK